jgi:NAD(P)H-dependent FMN reductase
MIVVLSCSLNPESSSWVLAQEAHRTLVADHVASELVDMRKWPLPLCDADGAYSHQNVVAMTQKLAGAEGIILASPIYNYDLNAVAKNLVELTGRAFENKVVGFLCAAGGMSSYMSVMGFANSLMLDFRSVVVPRFVYATGSAFSNGQIVDGKIRERVAELARATARLAAANSTANAAAA